MSIIYEFFTLRKLYFVTTQWLGMENAPKLMEIELRK